MGPGGESERSAVATWVLDTSKPKVSVISPKNNAQVKKASVTVKGKSQAGAEIRLQNAANGAIATTTAGKDGLWETTVAIGERRQRDHGHRHGPGRQREHRGAQPAQGIGQAHGRPDGLGLPVQGLEAAAGRSRSRSTSPTRTAAGSPAPRRCSPSASRASRRSCRGEIRTNGSGVATFTADDPDGRDAGERPRHRPRRPAAAAAPSPTARCSRSSNRRSTPRRIRLDRGPRRSYDPRHAGLALPPLRHSAAGGVPLLGLPPLHHLVRHLPPLPPRRGRRAWGCAASIPKHRPLDGTEMRACWTADAPGAGARRAAARRRRTRARHGRDEPRGTRRRAAGPERSFRSRR